jgi:hypothetical protein
MKTLKQNRNALQAGHRPAPRDDLDRDARTQIGALMVLRAKIPMHLVVKLTRVSHSEIFDRVRMLDVERPELRRFRGEERPAVAEVGQVSTPDWLVQARRRLTEA